MFDELSKYRTADHFFFRPVDSLRTVCNAPADQSGVYLMYALKGGRIELVYIGRSGKIKADGTMVIRKAGLGGLKDRLVNGKQFGEPRRNSLKRQMLIEGIEALDMYWYVTHGEDCNDCPQIIEELLLSRHIELYGRLPRWNRISE
jgi:hypothetical protein